MFFPDRARDAIGNGGQVLLNPTNGSSFTGTQVQGQQVASSQLRALETGRFVLQAAPTGFSAVVSPDGEVLQRTGVSEQRVLQDTVELRTGDTWAVSGGDWPTVTLSVLAVAAAWLLTRRQPSPSLTQPPTESRNPIRTRGGNGPVRDRCGRGFAGWWAVRRRRRG